MNDRLPQFFARKPINLVERSLAGLEGISTRQDGVKRLIGPLELLGKAN